MKEKDKEPRKDILHKYVRKARMYCKTYWTGEKGDVKQVQEWTLNDPRQ